METQAPPGGVEAEGGIVRRSLSLRHRKSLPATSQTPDKRHKVSRGDVETQGDIVRRVFSSRKRPSGAGQAPQGALKMQLKRKLHQTASRSSLAPDSKRPSGSRQPGPMTSLIDDDDITPRRLLQNITHTEAVASPVLHVRTEGVGEDVSLAGSSAREAPAPPRKVRAKRAGAAGGPAPSLPKSYVMGTFKHFAQTRVAADVYPVLADVVEAFLDRMALDLEAYALHAKRKTINVADVELLLRRQGYVTDKVPVEVLIEKYLPMEYRKMLIPVATSGNVVIPKQR